jgi:hypothetical protein
MKNLLSLLLIGIALETLFLLSCKQVTASKQVNIKSVVKPNKVVTPKEIVINNQSYYIYLGSDGHEYLSNEDPLRSGNTLNILGLVSYITQVVKFVNLNMILFYFT